MTYNYSDYGIDVTNQGLFRVIKRSDSSVVESLDLTTIKSVIFDGNQSNFGPVVTEDSTDCKVLDAVNVSGNTVNLDTSGQLCRTNNGPCRSINGKTVKLLIENEILVIGEKI